MRLVVFALAASLFLRAPFVRGDDQPREAGNAALQYWQAQECLLALIPNITDPSAAVPQFNLLKDGHCAPLNDDAIRAIERSAMSLYFLRRGSRIDKCEWGLAVDQLGPADEQGHVAAMPVLVGAACLRARYYFEQDLSKEAVDDLVALLRLAKHTGNGGRDGTRALFSQLSTEAKVLEIAARHLPDLQLDEVKRLSKLVSSVPVGEMLGNFFDAQQKQWVQWPTRFAQHAHRHDGDWDSYWAAIGMRADYRAEVGNLLRNAANNDPQQLLGLATVAADVLEQGKKLADLQPEEFRVAWRALLKKSTHENLIIELAAAEVEPMLNNLILSEQRHKLFQAGIAVARQGPDILKQNQAAWGRLKYRKRPHGFELTSQPAAGGKPLTLVFGRPEEDHDGR